jgi:hypothetical protein
MALPSGVYIIENVRNRNWAILTSDNDGDDVLSGTDANTNSGHKVERLSIFFSMMANDCSVGDQKASQWNISPS